MDFGPHSDATYGHGKAPLQNYYYERNNRVHPKGEFNNIDRAWRKEYLKTELYTQRDLPANMPDFEQNPDYRKARYNIFRRIYRFPMDIVEFKIMGSFLPWHQAKFIRHGLKGFGWGFAIVTSLMYYSLYSANDWSQVSNNFLDTYILPIFCLTFWYIQLLD